MTTATNQSPTRAPASLPATPAWDEGRPLGWAPMDAVHQEFTALVQALRAAPPAQRASALQALRAHTVEHFAEEERWMHETDFPARDCHVQEHAAVLASMAGVARRLVAGDTAAATTLAAALIDWFPGHADYLDAPLAHWLCSRRLGGKPVVLRRAAAPSPVN